MIKTPPPSDPDDPACLQRLSGEPRLVMTTRRTLMVRGALAGVAVAMPLLAACGSSDTEALAGASGQTAVVASETTAGDSVTTSGDSAATAAAVDGSAADVSAIGSGRVFPAGAELVVDFTYTSSSTVLNRNPYIAVWVEDSDGNLVDTISLWYKQGKGDRWLNSLRSWYGTSDSAADVSMSGATRVAGSYTVAWDGTDLDGSPVPQGDYTLYIESAREDGPHELTSASFTVGDEAFTIALADQGELTAASAELILA